MPTYEYECKSCGRRLEVVQSMTDAALTSCEVCGGELRKVFHPAGIMFKGSGFYATDNRKGTTSSSSSADAGSTSGTDAGSNSGSETTAPGKDAGSKPKSPEGAGSSKKKAAKAEAGSSGTASKKD